MRPTTLESAVRLRRAFLLLYFFAVSLSGCEQDHGIEPQRSYAFHKQQSSDVRVMSWNVKLGSILPPSGVRHESFARIVRAIDPDVIALQEVMWPDLNAILVRLMNQYIPLEVGNTWHVHTVSDNVIISRYPIIWQDGGRVVPYPMPQYGLPDFHLGFASALIDLPESFGGTELLLIAMHNKSGGDEHDVWQRQIHSDAMVRWIRDLRDSGQENTIVDGTPVVILGDMNVVPDVSTQPFKTLLSGDIVDEEAFGSDFRIDWDGTDMADARPSHNALDREYYTWRNDHLPFEPSALDRVIFTDSVMSVRRRFVLNTMTMLPNDLKNLGLQQTDVLFGGDPNYYDHLPLIVDFALGLASPE